MVAGHESQEPQLLALEAGELAVENQVVTVFVMAFEVDQIADVGEHCGSLDQLAIGGPQIQRSGELLPERAGDLGNLPGVRQIDTATLGELFDRGRAGFGRNRFRRTAERGLHHFEQQAITNATRVDLHHVDMQLAHDAFDDHEPGDDDVGAGRIEAGDLSCAFRA